MPKIGYGSDKSTKFLLPCGLKKAVVSNLKELEALTMQNKNFIAEIAHNISSRNRMKIVQRAKELKIRLTNPHSRILVAQNS